MKKEIPITNGKLKSDYYSEYIEIEHKLQDMSYPSDDSDTYDSDWVYFNKTITLLTIQYNELQELLKPELTELGILSQKLKAMMFSRDTNLDVFEETEKRYDELHDLLGIKGKDPGYCLKFWHSYWSRRNGL